MQEQVNIKLSEFARENTGRFFSANVTKRQIMVKPIVVASWGAHDWFEFKDVGLIFKVQGLLHKGYVMVTLRWDDLYAVHLFDKEGNQVGESVNGVYCDMLTDVIDGLVETP